MNRFDYIILGSFILILLMVIIRLRLRHRESSAKNIVGIKLDCPDEEKKDTIRSPEYLPVDDSLSSTVISISDPKTSEKKMVSEQLVADSVADEQNCENNTGITEPISLIKTFSAPIDERIAAIKIAGEKKLVDAILPLIDALYEPNPEISNAAAASLGEIGDPKVIEPLIEFSRRRDMQLMEEMSELLNVELENGSSSGETILDTRPETNPYNFKEMVVFKIDQLSQEYFQADGSPIPRKELVIKGLKDDNHHMRQMAVKVAIGIDSEELVEPLIEVLGDQFELESVRFMAAEALGGMRNTKSIDSLLKALKDENVAVRYSAAAALSGKKDERVVHALIESLQDPDPYVRSSVACTLGSVFELEVIHALFNCGEDADEVVKFSAAQAIARFPTDIIHDQLKSRTNTNVKNTILFIIDILGSVNDTEAINLLKEYLKNEDSEVVFRASVALSGAENVDILDNLIEASHRFDKELIELMKNPGLDKETTGFTTMEGKSGKIPSNLEKLAAKLKDDSPNIRGSAANALGDFKTEEAVGLLITALKDDNEFVRAAVITSLGKAGHFGAVESILKLEADKSEEVRYALAKALADTPRSEASDKCLKQMVKDKSKVVRRVAKQSIKAREVLKS